MSDEFIASRLKQKCKLCSESLQEFRTSSLDAIFTCPISYNNRGVNNLLTYHYSIVYPYYDSFFSHENFTASSNGALYHHAFISKSIGHEYVLYDVSSDNYAIITKEKFFDPEEYNNLTEEKLINRIKLLTFYR